jgi:hypothetical protein
MKMLEMVSRTIVVITIMLHDYGELCQMRPAPIRQAFNPPATGEIDRPQPSPVK